MWNVVHVNVPLQARLSFSRLGLAIHKSDMVTSASNVPVPWGNGIEDRTPSDCVATGFMTADFRDDGSPGDEERFGVGINTELLDDHGSANEHEAGSGH
jgi:hypothetical protein